MRRIKTGSEQKVAVRVSHTLLLPFNNRLHAVLCCCLQIMLKISKVPLIKTMILTVCVNGPSLQQTLPALSNTCLERH